ncbi:MAG: DUF2948 family protein [Rhodobacter sp.]|nr:DUF2948 family protein [Rhodobacter sp.]MCY4243514.1 DUF2948 family protein [Rhodobacter sp.]
MIDDARFMDGHEAPLRLRALGSEDLQVISALAQDAVFPASEMAWRSGERRLAILLNRFRWEDRGRAEPERVRSVLVIDEVVGVRSQGIKPGDRTLILSLMSLGFEPGEDGTGTVLLTLAGDGAVSADVEALDITLRDVTKPYTAPSRSIPKHPER